MTKTPKRAIAVTLQAPLSSVLEVVDCRDYCGSSEFVAHDGVCGECQDGYDDWSSCPEVDTKSVKVLPALEVAQLLPSYL